MTLSRLAGSATIYAKAMVGDNSAGWLNNPLLHLTDAQVFSVNDVRLQHSVLEAFIPEVGASLGALNPPEQYALEFDNEGEVHQMQVAAITDIRLLGPFGGTVVSSAGFTVTWETSTDADTKITLMLASKGEYSSGNDLDEIENFDEYVEQFEGESGEDVTATYRVFANLIDDGSATISAADLERFETGEVQLTIRRHRAVDQDLGLADGTVIVESWERVDITLVE